MRRWLGALLIVFCFAGRAAAQFPGPQGPIMFSSNCLNTPQFGFAFLCFDTTKLVFYTWGTTAFVPIAEQLDVSWSGALGGMTATAVSPVWPHVRGILRICHVPPRSRGRARRARR